MDLETDELWDLFNGVPDPQSTINTADKYMQMMKSEFRKVSKSDIVSKFIKGVFLSRIIIDKECKDDSDPIYRIYTHGTNTVDISDEVSNAFQKFIDERHYHFHYYANQLKHEIPRHIEEYLSEKYSEYHFWCMRTRSDGVTLLDAKTVFDLIIVLFDKNGIEENISFNNEIHPFFLGIKREWTYGKVNDLENNFVCYNELFRRAALDGEYFLYLYSDIFNTLSTMKYENAENKGTIISLEYYREDDFESLRKNYDIKIEFKEPIPIEEAQYKRIRKVMEISNQEYSLLINDKREIFAIGTISKENDRKFYKVSFNGYLRWNLCIDGKKYIEYENMIPRFIDTAAGISEEDIQKFKDTFSIYNANAFKRIVNEATKQGHGTMVVFAENAKEEADRLDMTGICIKPISLEGDGIVYASSSIDGAIMCDENGECFAIGIILDGKTSKYADSSRGARYNSAIRYLKQQKDKCKKTFIVVISEDGYVNCMSTNDMR